MGFKVVKYEADSGVICPLKIAATRVALVGAAPAGAIDGDAPAVKISKNKKESGIKPRGVVLTREIEVTAGSGEDAETLTILKRTFLPVLTTTAFAGAGFNLGAAISIDGVSWTVAKKADEENR